MYFVHYVFLKDAAHMKIHIPKPHLGFIFLNVCNPMGTQTLLRQNSCKDCMKCRLLGEQQHGNKENKKCLTIPVFCNTAELQESGLCCHEVYLEMNESTIFEVANKVFSENTFVEQIVHVHKI